jgi:FtsH-binding integral membrane protein
MVILSKNSYMLLFLKLIATAGVSLLLSLPLINEDARAGVLASVAKIGLPALLILIVMFLAAVAFYCRSLQRCLELIRPEARAASPRSVWLMFVIPYNFIEDFFIVHNIVKSLRAEASVNPVLSHLRSFGAISGLGWCTAQIISLVPNQIGEIAGVMALGLWAIHWRFIAQINLLLRPESNL